MNAIKISVIDIDGDAAHTAASGSEQEVRQRYPSDHLVQSLITEAIEEGEAEATYCQYGEWYTTRVVVL